MTALSPHLRLGEVLPADLDSLFFTPDILITAKGLASGFPLSGIAASEELMAKAWPGSQGGTYGANAVACAAACATPDAVREFVTEDGGPDAETAARVRHAAVDEGPFMLLCGAWNQAVCVIPSLAIDETAVDESLQGWATAVEVGTSGASR